MTKTSVGRYTPDSCLIRITSVEKIESEKYNEEVEEELEDVNALLEVRGKNYMGWREKVLHDYDEGDIISKIYELPGPRADLDR